MLLLPSEDPATEMVHDAPSRVATRSNNGPGVPKEIPPARHGEVHTIGQAAGMPAGLSPDLQRHYRKFEAV
ncbi:MAG: hypothetical protein O7F73_15605, partial [Gammaproteobacteria bacterium]|nr:hypothetical protein [Gammaproteobacteria bacterium]